MTEVISRRQRLANLALGPGAALDVGSNAPFTATPHRLSKPNPATAKLAWLRAVLANTVEGICGFAWDLPGMGLHISAGNGTRLNAKGNILIVNVDRAFITNFAAATGRARTLESTMPSLDDVIRSLLEREGPAAALPWSGPEAEDFARRVLETFKAATALTLSGDVRHVDHIVMGAVNPINGAIHIVHETDVHEHCHASRRNAKPFQVDQFLPALRAYLSGEGGDFLKTEAPAIMPSHGFVVGVMPVTAATGRHLQGQQLRFFLYVSHHKDDAAALEDTVLDHHLRLTQMYVEELKLDAEGTE